MKKVTQLDGVGLKIKNIISPYSDVEVNALLTSSRFASSILTFARWMS